MPHGLGLSSGIHLLQLRLNAICDYSACFPSKLGFFDLCFLFTLTLLPLKSVTFLVPDCWDHVISQRWGINTFELKNHNLTMVRRLKAGLVAQSVLSATDTLGHRDVQLHMWPVCHRSLSETVD